MTEDIMRSLDIFQHEKRGKERVITKVSDEESWKSVKESMIKNIGMGSIPKIFVTDADHGGTRTLYLKHEHDGRDLQLDYAERTIQHINQLWGKECVLETIVNGRKSVLRVVGNTLKVDRV
jgi:stage V sporulation protein R